MFLNPTVESIRFATSWCLPPTVLAIIRTAFSFYIFVAIITKLSYYAAQNEKYLDGEDFSYFTSLTYWGLGFYFAFAAFHSWSYARSGVPLLQRWPAILKQLHSLFYSTIVVFPFIVTIVYWGILYNSFPTIFARWSNVSQHALNSVFALFELVFAATSPMPWIHLLWLIILLVFYLAVAFITYATQHFYVYSFLDNRTHGRGRVAAYIFGILAACIIVFIVVWLLIWVRKRFTERRWKQSVEYSDREKNSRIEDTHI